MINLYAASAVKAHRRNCFALSVRLNKLCKRRSQTKLRKVRQGLITVVKQITSDNRQCMQCQKSGTVAHGYGKHTAQKLQGKHQVPQHHQKCFWCNGDHLGHECRFRDAVCHACGRTGHIQRACRKKGAIICWRCNLPISDSRFRAHQFMFLKALLRYLLDDDHCSIVVRQHSVEGHAHVGLHVQPVYI